MEIEYSKRFIKNFKKSPAGIKKLCLERINLFLGDPHNQALHNHRLIGKLKDYNSININSDWRIIFQQIDEKTVYLVTMGTHSHLYDR